MVNTLSGSVSAYRKENVKPRFIRIDEVMALLDVTRDEAMDIALAAVYKIGTAKGNTILINLEIFDDYMEQFREPPTEMKHPLPNVKGD